MAEKRVLSGLEINTDVIEKMVTLATLEVEGAASMSNKSVDLKGIMSTGSALKPVKVAVKNGAVDIDVFVSVKASANVKEVAEEYDEYTENHIVHHDIAVWNHLGRCP